MIYNKLEAAVGSENLLQQEPMSQHTTFRIGGEATYFVTPSTKEQVIQVLRVCKEEQIPYYVIGNGSNLLVGDYGFDGVIIQIGDMMSDCQFEEVDDTHWKVTAGAGIMLSRFANQIAKQGLQGFEYASGIPGTLGGAVTMNAGAYGGEIKNNIIQALVIDENGELLTLSKEELQLGYRTSIVQKLHYIVVEATFEFELGETEEIQTRIAELSKQRREKQPLEYASAGSTFKRPTGYYAGKLIQDCGLRGFRVGNIMISEKHCGFVINVGEGTAKEALQLIDEVQRRVFEQFGVSLETEVRFLGKFEAN